MHFVSYIMTNSSKLLQGDSMEDKLNFLCIGITITGLLLIFVTLNFLLKKSIIFSWFIGLGCGLIILGLGFLLKRMYDIVKAERSKGRNPRGSHLNRPITAKEKSGFIVSKFSYLFLCIYILIIHRLGVPFYIQIFGILFLLLLYIIDFILQIYYRNRY